MEAPGHQVAFVCDGHSVTVECGPGESLLSVLRERLGITSVKDGCAPQGQCGCCTVLVDGEARVACVTPVERVADRAVTTLSGLDPAVGDRLA
ncbi:MAG: (2Fe-2S)-binding protein, partial [Actinomycetota bacterium]